VVHTIAFSPSFVFDGTVFLAGFNLGVGRSTDGGRTFELLWSEPGFNTKLSLSPGFGTGGDRSVLAMLTPMLPEDQVLRPDSYVRAAASASGTHAAES